MFDFGFRPWGDVIGDVGNQVKEQINRYHQNRLQEQLLSRQDNLRNQDWAREDSIRNQGFARQEADLNRPVSDTVRDMLLDNTGYEPQYDSVIKQQQVMSPVPQQYESEMDWTTGKRENGMPAWMKPIPRPGEAVKQEYAPDILQTTEQVERPRPQITQRDINQAAQVAPAVKAAKYKTGGYTFDQKMQLAMLAEKGKNERAHLAALVRQSEGGADRSVKLSTAREAIALGYARIRSMEAQRTAMIQAGASDAEINSIAAETREWIRFVEKAEAGDLALYEPGDAKALGAEGREKIKEGGDKFTKAVGKKKGQAEAVINTVTKAGPAGIAPPPNGGGEQKTITYMVGDKPVTRPWSQEAVDGLTKAGKKFTVK